MSPGFFSSKGLSYTNWIIIINVIFFFIFYPIIISNESFINYIALNPSNVMNGKYIWTIITSMFMHGSISHLFVNMISLLFIGNFVEKLIGRKRFLSFYLIAGLVASLLFIAMSYAFGNTELGISLFGSPNTFAVGASGAIFGLGGLLAILTPRLPVLVFFIVPMPMWAAMVFLMGVLAFFSAVGGLPIGNSAHLGGLLCGLIFGLYIKKKYKRKARMISRYFR